MNDQIDSNQRGFAMLEILAAVTLVAITLLSIGTMYLTAHSSLDRSADMSVAVGLSRQILEDMRSIPWDSLVALDGLDTTQSSTLPANEPEREIARRWRYAVAGEGSGWTYSASEKAYWPTFVTEGPATEGSISVTSPSSSLRAVTVTLTVFGQANDVRVSTLISRTNP